MDEFTGQQIILINQNDLILFALHMSPGTSGREP